MDRSLCIYLLYVSGTNSYDGFQLVTTFSYYIQTTFTVQVFSTWSTQCMDSHKDIKRISANSTHFFFFTKLHAVSSEVSMSWWHLYPLILAIIIHTSVISEAVSLLLPPWQRSLMSSIVTHHHPSFFWHWNRAYVSGSSRWWDKDLQEQLPQTPK